MSMKRTPAEMVGELPSTIALARCDVYGPYSHTTSFEFDALNLNYRNPMRSQILMLRAARHWREVARGGHILNDGKRERRAKLLARIALAMARLARQDFETFRSLSIMA